MWRWGLILAVLGGAYGCAHVDTDYNPRTDWRPYRTFAWDPRQGEWESMAPPDCASILASLRPAVEDVLNARGLYREERPDQADLSVLIHLECPPLSGPTTSAESHADLPAIKLTPLVLGPRSVTPAFNDDALQPMAIGTLLINIGRQHTPEPLWQAWIPGAVPESTCQAGPGAPSSALSNRRHQRQTQKWANRLLADFPPPYRPRLSPLPETNRLTEEPP